MSLFQLFHQQSKYGEWRPNNPHDTSDWPEAWTTTFYKEYERFPRVLLPKPTDIQNPVGKLIKQRSSARTYTATVLEDTLSSFLWYTCGETDPDAVRGSGRRASASAGARYPIEAYLLLLKDCGNIAAGTYHYAVRTHALERIRNDVLSPESAAALFRYPETVHASGVLILSGVFSRETAKYKERGYRHVLLEAGGIGEQCYLVAGALSLGCVGMSGYQDSLLEEHLGIDGVTESIVHTIVFG